MTCTPASNADNLPRLAIAGRGFGATFLRLIARLTGNRNTYGPAQTTESRRRRVVMLLSEREVLRALFTEAKRRHKASSHYEARLKEITHEIMRIENGEED